MHDITGTLLSEATISPGANQRTSAQIAGAGCPKTVYNYRRLRKASTLRLAGAPFAWPSSGRDAYYVVDPKTELVFLCLPGGIQVFHPANHVPPGGGLHFIRLSTFVVLETPEMFAEKQAFRNIMQELGLIVVQFGEPQVGTDAYLRALPVHNGLCRDIRLLGPKLEYDSFDGLNPLLIPMLCSWASNAADWNATGAQTVLRQLACDLDRSESWKLIVKALAPIVQARGVDFEALTLLGASARRKQPTLFIRSRYDAEKADALLKSIWKSSRIGRLPECDLPGTIRRVL